MPPPVIVLHSAGSADELSAVAHGGAFRAGGSRFQLADKPSRIVASAGSVLRRL